MSHSTSTQDQIHELKRKISAMEWDIPNLKNKEVKYQREKELNSSKNRLSKLLNADPMNDNDVV